MEGTRRTDFMGKVTSDDTKVNIQVTGEDDVV